MDQICLHAAKQLGKSFGLKTYGFDMAVDRNGNTWVFEANERPAIAFFRKLKDKSYYHEIWPQRLPDITIDILQVGSS